MPTRRRFSIIQINGLLAVLLLGGFARASDAPEIRLQYWTDPASMRASAEIFETYEREHPGVKVVVGQSAARNLVDDPQRVLCAIVGGDPPDIIVFDRYAVGEWAARNVRPTLAAIGIFTFMGTWNDFMGPLMYLSDQSKYPLSLGLFAFQTVAGGNQGMLMAASLLMTLPVIALFFVAQRHFIQGLAFSGIKG